MWIGGDRFFEGLYSLTVVIPPGKGVSKPVVVSARSRTMKIDGLFIDTLGVFNLSQLHKNITKTAVIHGIIKSAFETLSESYLCPLVMPLIEIYISEPVIEGARLRWVGFDSSSVSCLCAIKVA